MTEENGITDVSEEEARRLYESLLEGAEKGGYYLNPDMEMTMELVRALIINARRYGYPACPCRMATGIRDEDRDIICPCDYRDDDISEYGTCYCGLYVSETTHNGDNEVEPIPDRRTVLELVKDRDSHETTRIDEKKSGGGNGEMMLWRCTVCGYVCVRETPPDVCPICRAGVDRFEALATVSREGLDFDL